MKKGALPSESENLITLRDNCSRISLKRTYLFPFFLFILIFSNLGFISIASSKTTSLQEGMYWKINIERIDEVSGLGKYEGNLKTFFEGYQKYEVEDISGDEIRISLTEMTQWSNEASGFFEQLNAEKLESRYRKSIWVVERSSTRILAAPADSEDKTGKICNELIDLENINSKRILRGWIDLEGNYFEKKFNISESTINFKDFNLETWDAYYSGETIANWYQNLFTNNPQELKPTIGKGEQHLYYDRIFGIMLGFEFDSEYEYHKGHDSIKQISIMRGVVFDSNMWHINSFNLEPAIADIEIDGEKYPPDTLPKSFLFPHGSAHNIVVPAEITSREIKYVFQKWNNGVNTNKLTLISESDEQITAEYTSQYELEIISKFGSAVGEGWYDAGSAATFSIESDVPFPGILGNFGVKYIFDHWSGDYNSTNPNGEITMDSPKKIEAIWRGDYTLLYVLIVLVSVVVTIVLAIYSLTRRIDQVKKTLEERYHIIVKILGDSNLIYLSLYLLTFMRKDLSIFFEP